VGYGAWWLPGAPGVVSGADRGTVGSGVTTGAGGAGAVAGVGAVQGWSKRCEVLSP
jgi:hypothetical protein